MPTPQEIREVCQAGKDRDPGWYRIHRRLSIHVTALLLGTPITLNQVSLLMMAMGATGAALMTSANLWLNGLGGVCLYASFLLDKVDGEMARYRGKQAVIGILLDRFHHRLVEPLLFLAVGYRAFTATGSTLPLFAALATMLAANIVEETQQLPAFIAAKHARETRRWPAPASAGPSPNLERAAAVMRSLKTFRMFITVLPLVLVAIGVEAWTGRPVTTWLLLVSAVALWVYVVFQAWYYAHGQLDADIESLTRELPPLPERAEGVAAARATAQRAATEPVAPATLPEATSVPREPGSARDARRLGAAMFILFAFVGLSAGAAASAPCCAYPSVSSCSRASAGSGMQPHATRSRVIAPVAITPVGAPAAVAPYDLAPAEITPAEIVPATAPAEIVTTDDPFDTSDTPVRALMTSPRAAPGRTFVPAEDRSGQLERLATGIHFCRAPATERPVTGFIEFVR